MTPFLKEIAQDLYKKYGNDMSRVAMIFPNKRAGIFMNEYFSQIMGDSPLCFLHAERKKLFERIIAGGGQLFYNGLADAFDIKAGNKTGQRNAPVVLD